MEVRVHIEKIRHNVETIRRWCRDAGIGVLWMTKGCHAFAPVLDLLADSPEEAIGDVRLFNLQRIRRRFAGTILMAQLPGADLVLSAVTLADAFAVSDEEHLRLLDRAAAETGRRPRALFMVDVGNGREGVPADALMALVQRIRHFPHLVFGGIGTSIGCYAGYRPGPDDLDRLVAVAEAVEAGTGQPVAELSVGSGTMVLDMVRRGLMPRRISQVRIGAAVWVGEKPPTGEPIQGLYTDGFIFRGEVLEVSTKSFPPAEKTGADAFGRRVEHRRPGSRRIALLDFGMIDVDPFALTPLASGVIVVGATSDYTICDMTDTGHSNHIGDHLDFRMAYSAVARAMASKEVPKTIVGNGEDRPFGRCTAHAGRSRVHN